MSSIDRRTRDHKVSYLARWRDPSGRQRKKTFGRKIDAQRFLTTLDSSLLSSTYIDPDKGRVTLEAWARRWLAAQGHLKVSTQVRYANILANYVIPEFGATPIAKISASDIQIWLTSLAAGGLAPASVRYAHRVLSLSLKWAVVDGRIPRNVATGVPLPPVAPVDHRFLSPDELTLLATKAGRRELEVLFLGLTGLRFGEFAALKVHHVDLRRRRILVVASVSEVHGKLVWSSPKSHARRTIAIPGFLAEALASHLEGRPRDAQAFPAPLGGVLRCRGWSRQVLTPACKESALGHIRVHDLRHTAASLMVSAGANVKAVQKALGHASAAMTLDVYSGLFSDDVEQVADRLDSLMRPESAPDSNVVPIKRDENTA